MFIGVVEEGEDDSPVGAVTAEREELALNLRLSDELSMERL